MEFWHFLVWRQCTKFYEVEKLVSQTTLTSSHPAPSGPGPPPSQISKEPHSSQRGKAIGAYAIAWEPVTLCVNVTCLDITGFIVWNWLGDGALSASVQVVGANEWVGCHADKLGWQGEQLKRSCRNANVILKFNHAVGWLNGNFFSVIKKPSQMPMLLMSFYLHDPKEDAVLIMNHVNS